MDLITASRANAILYWFLLDKSDPEDCFILPSNICPEVVLTFLKTEKRILFADIDPVHFCLDMNDVRKIMINTPVKGILYNHTYGTLYTPSTEIADIKRGYPDILLIDDKCLCTPEFTIEESVFDLTLFSTNNKKQADLGFGGYAWVKERIRKIIVPYYSENDFVKMQDSVKECPVNFESWNNISQLDWLNAEKLTYSTTDYFNQVKINISKGLNHKQKLINIYRKNLPPTIILNNEFQNWRFNIRTNIKNDLLNTIFSEGFFAGGHYKSLGTIIEKRAFKIAEILEKEVINLFIDKYFSVKQAFNTCRIINKSIPGISNASIQHNSDLLQN